MSDLIERQAAIRTLEALTSQSLWYVTGEERHVFCKGLAVAQKQLSLLPSAQQERKKGKWIIVTDSRGRHARCPYCGEWKYHSNQKFCGECGAEMIGEANV